MSVPVAKAELATFLEKYVELKFNFSAACRAIERHPTTMYDWLARNEEFAHQFNETKRIAGDVCFAEAMRRAVEGVEKPVFGSLGPGMGRGIVGHVQEYSDSLLIQCLKALRPEFRDHQTIDVNARIDLSTEEIAAKLAAIIAEARMRRDNGDVIDGEIVQPALQAPDDNSDPL